ncbi:NADPH-dependent FMN reductase [Microbacterium sp. A93]|uniref:NADPH-dependent FMN reductase n=1 Tax=Microbacterium sp. A93 TaxID=3450716 RepID=UPI003F421DE5
MLDLVILVGHPDSSSRSRLVSERLAKTLFSATGVQLTVVELADHRHEMFGTSAALDAAADTVSSCDLLLVASPTFNGAYSGLLKAFFDRQHMELAGVTAIPIMTGGNADNALTVSLVLAPLLLGMGASLPFPGVFLTTDQVDAPGAEWQSTSQRVSASLSPHSVIGPFLREHPIVGEF